MRKFLPILALATLAALPVSAQEKGAPDSPPVVAPPAPPPKPAVLRVYWVRKPFASAVAGVYPKAALAARQSGRVTMSCAVLADGWISGCKIILEDPAGMGFGEAALSLAPQYRMRPTTDDGRSVAGATVSIPMTFSPPD